MEFADALMEEKKLMSEAKYRNYMSNIDKALRNFEYSSEWADLISALGKLSKAISSNTQYQVIPRRIKISKRLAQCMHPALPGGVHLKALETYAVIFSKTGPERLATELFIYSAGLFPLLGYAAMNVRPALLGIYETHFVPLGERLRPALSGFLSGVLPGYECGLDHFERTNSLLMKVCNAVNPLHFYTVLWECVATNSSIRLPAITYLIEHFNKRLGMEEQTYMMGQNREIMMSGLCACLNDSVILVQRNGLEFILLGFPMHTTYLPENDLVKLVTNGLNTILRRDMSLNRRLYSWLLGAEISKKSPISYDAVSVGSQAEEEHVETYFEKHSKHVVVQSLIQTLKYSLECKPVDLKPYRIMISLLDKAEIGSTVLDFVLIDIIRTMSLSSSNLEVIKSANLLFATFDPAYIWSFMTIMYEKCCNRKYMDYSTQNSKIPTKNILERCGTNENNKFQCEVGSGEPTLFEICFLTEYLLETISLETYNETTRVYLPKVFLAITRMLTIHLEHITHTEVTASLKLCMKIVSRVQPMITSPIKIMPRTHHTHHGYSSSDERHAACNKNGSSSTTADKNDLLNNIHSVVGGTNILEKSKSDSKLNASSMQNDDKSVFHSSSVGGDEYILRSNSNQHIERKSPKRKKSKSYSKLSELDKEICPDTGEIIEPQQSSSDLDTPLSIKKLKSKAKTNMRLRSSPKKSRPKDIRLSGPSSISTEPKSLDPVLLKTSDAMTNDDPPKSAPAAEQRASDEKDQIRDEFVFDCLDANNQNQNMEEEYTILEKCIRQYEIFFELFLARHILQVKEKPQTSSAAAAAAAALNDKCRIEVQILNTTAETETHTLLNVGEAFKNEDVFEDLQPERLKEIEKIFETLKVSGATRSQRLQSLLSRSIALENNYSTTTLNVDSASDFSDCEFRDCMSNVEEMLFKAIPDADERTEQRMQALTKFRTGRSLLSAIKLASNLLVEMSTFPNCNKNIMFDKIEREIPSWLKVLCIVASYTQSDKELQLSTISALFDLISLLKSQIEHTTSPGVTFVVMLPLLKFGHVSFIENKTRVFQLLVSTLWNYLGEPKVEPSQITSLLYQLHNCLESGLVENIIGNRMFAHSMQQQFTAADALANDKEKEKLNGGSLRYKVALPQGAALSEYRNDRASEVQLICVSPGDRTSVEQLKDSEWKSCRKFELLWHLGRDKQPSKGFEKTLLKFLDILELPYYMSTRTFVTNWLRSALLRGDLSRLIKPLYKILLSPKSKRISIIYLHMLQQGSKDNASVAIVGEESSLATDGAPERDVYAISSEHGNIRYHHIDSASSKKRSPIRSFQKKIFGVTLSSKNKTSNFLSDKAPVPIPLSSEPIASDSSMGLIINPLEGSNNFDDDIVSVADVDLKSLENVKDEKRKDSASADEKGKGDCEKAEAEFTQDFTDDSDSSFFDSESDNRETSVEKDDSLTLSSSGTIGNLGSTSSTANLKRYAGDCERVTEMLSQHERTKNRKTYRLTREKTPGDSSITSNVDEQVSAAAAAAATTTTTPTTTQAQAQGQAQTTTTNTAAAAHDDSAHPADEYFGGGGGSSSIPSESKINTTATGESTTTPQTETMNAKHVHSKKKSRHHRAQQPQRKHLTKKLYSSGEKKRLSCISKTSTDSNNSYAESEGQLSMQEEGSNNSEQSEIEEQTDSRSQSASASVSTTMSTINVEDKRRNLMLETSSRETKTDWELTPEAIEKSKQNLQILRQNAGQNLADASSKRSSTKSTDSHKWQQAERLQFYHNHMLVYYGVYDTKQALYAFQTLRNIISSDARTFLCLSITTSLSSGSLRQLLVRHRKSISGKGFAGNISNSEFAQTYRGCMHLEVLVTICLYYARGFFCYQCYEGAKSEPTSHDDIVGNCRVQLESVEMLTLICIELIEIVKSMGSGLACYIADVMSRCKLQKVILHCINSSVCSMAQKHLNTTTTTTTSKENQIPIPIAGDTAAMAEDILTFNNPKDENLHAESFQIQLLRLLRAVIRLEHEVELLKTDGGNTNTNSGDSTSHINISPTRLTASDGSAANVKYLPNCPISQQPMFLAAVLGALQDERLRHLHRNWTDLITSSLNCFNFGSLTNIVISVVHQLCNNLDRISKYSLKDQCGFPPDYVVSQLEAITVLCHYCLLDSSQQTTLSHLFNQAYPQTSVASQSSNSSGQLLNSIVHSFLSSSSSSQIETQSARNPQLVAARNAVLSHLSRIVASMAAIWDSELGHVRQVKQQMMEFLSPVSLHHGVNFLAAVAATWQERGQIHRRRPSYEERMSNLSFAEQYKRNSTLQATPEQTKFLTLVTSIRVMPIDSFVQTVHQVVKSPPPIHRPPKHLTIEVSVLELFYFYLRSAPATQLGDSWSSLLLLLRDGLNLVPPAQFVLLMILHEFMQRCPDVPFQDKKDIRDLHDVTSRLIDSLSSIAGSCLEQTTWLRRNLAVKEDIAPVSLISGSGRESGSFIGGQAGQQHYSVQSQSVLGVILANLLDVAYGSQEKDKVVNIVTTLLYNITPYLKNHTTRNIPSFYACSSLLASLSGYQYTRKAWRKDMFELLLDPAFFQMDISCLPFWKQIMDSLMTYDNTTFRELMSRVSLTQTGTLNIFTSREQEYEQRAMLLKRLAFVIFCSEFDQYNKYMPEIQEQLANSLRLLSMVPAVQAAVFLCFRVLLLRMAPDHVTSLWPIIIAEMVQVFLSMEQELKCDSDDLSQQMRLLSGMEGSWSSNSSLNGLSSQSHLMHWRSVQLETSKLLEMGCVLPATNLPHFQMYRWAFVGTEFDALEETPVANGETDERTATASICSTTYVPHVRRIARLMDMKYPVHSPLQSSTRRGEHLMLTCQQINSLQDLYGFFSTLSLACPNPRNFHDMDKEVAGCLAEIEQVLAKDFLEKMSTSTTPR